MITTLISDFGHGDNSVAITKGMLLKQLPHLQLIDISHEVPPFDLIQCSYLFKSAYHFFPDNTLHISLFNSMNADSNIVLLTKINNQFIITADNGWLSHTFSSEKFTVWKYENSESQTFVEWIKNIINLIEELIAANFELKAIKLIAHQSKKEVIPIQAKIQGNSIECQIVHVDRYGNAVLNITKADFERHRNNRNFSILVPMNPPITQISNTYSSMITHTKYCMFNSAGYLEIGVKNASAAQLLGLKAYENGKMIYNTVIIEFQ